MRLPKSEYTSRPWRIHEFAKDFTLEDLWKLPTPGGPDDLDRLVRQFTTGDESDREFSPVFRVLFAIRWQLGKVMGWDKPDAGINKRVPSLRDRLPVECRQTLHERRQAAGELALRAGGPVPIFVEKLFR